MDWILPSSFRQRGFFDPNIRRGYCRVTLRDRDPEKVGESIEAISEGIKAYRVLGTTNADLVVAIDLGGRGKNDLEWLSRTVNSIKMVPFVDNITAISW